MAPLSVIESFLAGPLGLPTIVGLVALPAGLLGVSLWRAARWRHRLARVCERHQLAPAANAPAYLRERARRLGGKPTRRARLDRILTGSDADGRFFLAHRRAGRQDQQLLHFELDAGSGLREFFARPRGDVRERAVALRWEPLATDLLSNRTHALATRLLHHMANHVGEHGPTALALELQEERVFISSTGKVEDEKYELFVELALKLRRSVLSATHKARGARPGPGRSRPSTPLPPVRVRTV